jgi:hypothetical protein
MKQLDYFQIIPLLSLEVKHLLYMPPRLFERLVAPGELFVALLEFKFPSRSEISFFEILLVLGYTDFEKGPYHSFQVYYEQNACRQSHLAPHPL